MKVNPKVLVIGSVWPEPNSSAAGGRMLGLLRLFKKQNWQVVFGCPAADSIFSFDLSAIGVEKINIILNDSSFDAFIQALQPDMVVFDRFLMEEQFGWRVAEQCPNALRIIDTVDLHFLRHARHLALKENSPLTQSDMQSDMAKREIASILRSDISLIISEFEMDLLVRKFKVDPAILFYLPLLVPKLDDERVKKWLPFEDRNGFVIIGNFLHEPNWDSVQFLKIFIWPLIRKQIPEAQLRVYGAYPPQKAMQLNRPNDGFLVLGRVDNAQAAIGLGRVCLAPLRFGAGVKGKLVEAMQCGTPSVTTDIGAEGMQGLMPWSGCIANTAEAIAKAAVELYTDKSNWLIAQRNGIAILNTRNTDSLFENEMIEHLISVFENLASHRSNNFLGAVLQFHTLRSSQFMSRWIEEKNKRS
jgi:O-antigen biosynthesis protein